MSSQSDVKLSQTNQRLKAAKVGVAIEARGGSLYLRATLPPKPGSTQTKSFQQRIALGTRANPAALKLAEAEARKVGALLDCKEFSWEPYLNLIEEPDTIGHWVEKFEQDYFTRRKKTPASQSTWQDDYAKVFSRLDSNASLTVTALHSAIVATPPDSRTRRRFVMVCTKLAQFAGLEANFKPLSGNYSAKKVQPRNLPDDATIAYWREKISNPLWQRGYGLIATYGLRPHELFHLTFDRFPLLEVGEATKTGSRIIYPLYPEWAEKWSLIGELPTVSGKNNSVIGNRVTHAFKRYKIPFKPYDLRHAWAVRAIEFRLENSLASAQMGHSVQVHCDIYQQWIRNDVHERAYQLILSYPERPSAPCLNLD